MAIPHAKPGEVVDVPAPGWRGTGTDLRHRCLSHALIHSRHSPRLIALDRRRFNFTGNPAPAGLQWPLMFSRTVGAGMTFAAWSVSAAGRFGGGKQRCYLETAFRVWARLVWIMDSHVATAR